MDNNLFNTIKNTPIKLDDFEGTLNGYFGTLLLTLWREGEGFNSKRPFGNSGWDYDVARALAFAGVIDYTVDDDDPNCIGHADPDKFQWYIDWNQDKAHKLIEDFIIEYFKKGETV